MKRRWRTGGPTPADFHGVSRWFAPGLFRLSAVVMVVLLLAGTQAQSSWLFRCEYTGTPLSACCCPSGTSSFAEEADRIARGCCCHVEKVDASLPTGAAASQTLSPPALVLVAVAPPWSVPPFALRGLASLARAPEWVPPELPRAGPPLTIVHRRLLL